MKVIFVYARLPCPSYLMASLKCKAVNYSKVLQIESSRDKNADTGGC